MSTFSIVVQSFVALLFIAGVGVAIQRSVQIMAGSMAGQEFGRYYTQILHKQLRSAKIIAIHLCMAVLCAAGCYYMGWMIMAVTFALLYVIQYAALRYYATVAYKLHTF